MISLAIPGFKELSLKHLVLDYNGTLAIDGKLINGVKEKIQLLSAHLKIHVVTGDTFGTAKEQLKNINCKLIIAPKDNQSEFKLGYIKILGENSVVGVGNGRNDIEMLKASALGIAVLQQEGLSTQALLNSDIVVGNIMDAFELLLNPTRLKASLRA